MSSQLIAQAPPSPAALEQAFKLQIMLFETDATKQ
jgi:hypothetical protein